MPKLSPESNHLPDIQIDANQTVKFQLTCPAQNRRVTSEGVEAACHRTGKMLDLDGDVFLRDKDCDLPKNGEHCFVSLITMALLTKSQETHLFVPGKGLVIIEESVLKTDLSD
jgi:hypothetical protein